MKPICILLVTMICLLGTGSAQRASKSRLVGNLMGKNLVDGCGCEFQFRGTKRNSEKYMFAESIEAKNSSPWMNIDGRDVVLRVIKDWKLGKERVGSRSVRKFAAAGISVTATFIATRVCAAADESCESSDYNATFVVKKGGRVETVKAFGTCGC